MTKPKPKKSPPLTIRLDPDIKEGIEALAREDDRSVSAFINRVLRSYLDQQGTRRPKK